MVRKKKRRQQMCLFDGCENNGREVSLPAAEFKDAFPDPKTKTAKRIVMCVCEEHEPVLIEVLKRMAIQERIKMADAGRGYA